MLDSNARLLLVSVFGGNHLGTHLRSAAQELGIETRILDTEEANTAPLMVQRAYRLVRGDRPLWLRGFSRRVLNECRAFEPTWCLSTGRAPIDAATLRALSEAGVVTINFPSDDPWNPLFRSSWLMEATPRYDRVFTPRTANLEQFEKLGCACVRYLPFGYNPALHHPAEAGDVAADVPETDVVFIGGGDRDRLPFIEALRSAGLRVRVFGGYWNRYRSTRDIAGGSLGAAGIRAVLARSKLSICLVRRANRDGHVMRSYEEPAMGACMLFEDTADHRALFGASAARSAAFRSPEQLASVARRYCLDPDLRAALRQQLHSAVVEGGNTYRERLERMLLPADA
jgi:hypothetical protein